MSQIHQQLKNSQSGNRIEQGLLKNSGKLLSSSPNSASMKIHQSYREQNSQHISKTQRRSYKKEQRLAYQKLSQLSERLKNIHHFYKLRINQEKDKNAERNSIFMSIFEELQKNHNQKITELQQLIQNAKEQKKQILFVDDKVSQIKGSIDEIVKQADTYKHSNQKLQKQIMHKEQTIRQKARILEKAKAEEIDFRNQLEEFMKLKIRQNRKQKQMLQMIDKVIGVN